MRRMSFIFGDYFFSRLKGRVIGTSFKEQVKESCLFQGVNGLFAKCTFPEPLRRLFSMTAGGREFIEDYIF